MEKDKSDQKSMILDKSLDFWKIGRNFDDAKMSISSYGRDILDIQCSVWLKCHDLMSSIIKIIDVNKHFAV